jgi:hypothetical protein
MVYIIFLLYYDMMRHDELLKHFFIQIIFLNLHMKDREHWLLVSINTNTRFMQVLDSMYRDITTEKDYLMYLRNTERSLSL